MKFLISLLVACALVAPAAAVAADAAPSLVEAGNAAFPHRTYILTLPKRASISAADVAVAENGEAVAHLTVTPARATAHATGTVLLIDASKSMAGKAIKSAMSAARAFAGRRNPNQQIALITFNSSTSIILPFSSDNDEISQALKRTPALAQGTHIYDAVDQAVGLIDRANLKAGTIVLLSDGADVGSSKKFADVQDELAGHHIRLFSVGLRSGAFDASTLKQLAAAGNGSFSVASSDNLSQVFDQLGFRLASEYLVDYVSFARPDVPVHVRATVAGFGGAAIAGYRSPALHVDAKTPVKASSVDKVLQSPATMIVVALLIAGLVFFAIRSLFGRDSQSIQARLAEFVSVTREDERRRREEVREALRRETGLMQQLALYRRFAEDAALADISTPPARLVIFGLFGAVIAAILAIAVLGALGVFFAVAPLLAMRAFVSKKLKRKRSLFADQLADNLEVLASALRAGHSLVGALAVVVDDAAEPSKSEFQRVLADEQLGVPLEQALGVTVKRMQSRDLDQVAVVAVLQRDAGANSAEVLDQIVDNIRSRQEIRRLVRVLTAQGRMARWIVSLLPVGLLVIITMLNSSYMHPMWHETIGHVALVGCAIMITLGSMIIGRIVDIEA